MVGETRRLHVPSVSRNPVGAIGSGRQSLKVRSDATHGFPYLHV